MRANAARSDTRAAGRTLRCTVVRAGALLVALAAPAMAIEPEACNALRGRLAALDKAGTSEASQWGEAIQKQREAFERGRAQYERYCSPSLFGGGPDPRCPAITQRNAEMQRNLAQLEKRYQRMGAAGPRAERLNVLASLKAYGCTDPRQAPVDQRQAADTRGTVTARWGADNGAPLSAGGPTTRPAPAGRYAVPGGTSDGRTIVLQGPNGPTLYREDNGRLIPLGPAAVASAAPQASQPTGLFGALFGSANDATPPGVATRSEATLAEPSTDMPEGELPSEGGAYRTLCVRTCDGYYFPISYATSRARFATDARVCQAMCPGTETRLFVHRNPGEDSEQAISADGEGIPYTRLPNAMRYRREVVSGCACGRADPTLLPASIDSDPTVKRRSVEVGDLRPELPLPRPRPRADDDPDTEWNRANGFVPRAIDPTPVEAAAPPGPYPEAGGAAPANASVGAGSGPRKVRVVGPKYFAGQ
ncbi:DUF2865 domain-containing protein [Methyloraptor flagellatus]|uniref:DUF2865 domain-containing protein n=1 Tax=Methyloraptor flagellatus TaxID=3162530 RepID=A0AAU7X7A9_9HYPH